MFDYKWFKHDLYFSGDLCTENKSLIINLSYDINSLVKPNKKKRKKKKKWF